MGGRMGRQELAESLLGDIVCIPFRRIEIDII